MKFIPEHIQKAAFAEYGETLEGAAEAIWQYNKAIVDNIYDLIPCVKPQSAMYEQFGIPGLMAYKKTIEYCKSKDLVVIGDIKRGDIGSTSEAYAVGHLGKVKVGSNSFYSFDEDFATLAPYMGSDSINPFKKVCQEEKKGLFILVKTSNPSSGEFQDRLIDGRPLYEWVAEKVVEWEHLKSVWEGICNVVQTAVMLIGSILKAAFDIITLPYRMIWENCKEIIFAVWEAIKSVVSSAINAVSGVISTVMGAIQNVISTIWTAISTKISSVVNTIKTIITTVFNAVKTVVSTVWNAIKSTISTVVDGIKNKVSNVFNSVKSTVSSVFNGIKSTATSVWNGIKNAILTPIEAAKDKIKGIVDKIQSFFANMKISLPKIKLPHFKISGKLSIAPPSVPKLSIDWYKEGGIMTKPTVFGMNGTNLMAGGEAGAEAILPLKGFYDNLETILSNRLDMTAMEQYLAVIAANSSKGIYLEDGTLVGHLLPVIDNKLGQAQKLNRRLSL